MDNSKIKATIIRSRVFRSFAIIMFFLAVFPILVLMFGQHYLPSREYMQMTATIAPVLGYTMGTALFLLTLIEYRNQQDASWKSAIGVVASPFFGFFVGNKHRYGGPNAHGSSRGPAG
ncbi:hypothetical protein [Brucella intermedia]|uniref:hypothetical protein n=1 Tax=Brucella intermedia TaxID=94625 RepID=UPI00224B4B97|nr:hypothetical protein [Brucella intermedia]